MTAEEQALVVYAEAKGYEIEVHIEKSFWDVKGTPGFFNFATCGYRIKNREDERKVYDELSDFFKPLYTPEQPSKLLSDMERVKYKPAGFSCNAKYYTREGIEEMNKAKEVKPEAIPATESGLEEIKAEDNNCFWVKDKIQGITITWKFVRSADVSDSFFVLDISPKPAEAPNE